MATAVRRRDGDLTSVFQAPEGVRYAVLFVAAPGSKPTPPFTTALYERFGAATARIHHAASSFVSTYERAPLDLAHFLDRPLATLRVALAARPDDWATIARVAGKVRRQITALAPSLD